MSIRTETAFLLCCALMACGSGAAQSGSHKEQGSGSPVVRMEHQLANAEQQHDKSFFQNALDDQLVYVAYNGLVFTKSKILSSLQYIDVNRYTMENFKVRNLGPTAALVTYDLKIKAKVAGKELPETQYASSVWLRQGKQWKLIFHQATPANH